ncbi:hypothetical protein [Desulfurobacterium pacificum]|uniref:hypothetical protein n=1 Tax=Desulfurobacterium pacificum TaxID=240166 RepID=UPI0024B8513E|nr:hypothetical protein [Desulfurobacterium pacificum]
MEKELQKTKIKENPYKDIFVFLDRICPFCGSPIAEREITDGKRILVCTNPLCNFLQKKK